ncbi:MAG: hypothetical protein KatS3mg033_0076 [Thermonema sp.]|uniref:protein phosphatase 2C domain-containing protein n=1 Tax=Thermonema sp. TaxID=2231181 RepID=UPI0021DBD302|nr:protein phosphatase 2C domain-containing protein [Thermonema sp.]GIV38276.1 MAG: hypothetical protein KatS3mg033_0076 [Thermonema sp.]
MTEIPGFDFVLDKIPGLGEDAPPLRLWNARNRRGLIAVFDGMGGAGSAPCLWQGEERPGAYVAARLAAQVLRDYFETYEGSIEGFAEGLEQQLKTVFAQEAARLYPSGQSKLRSRLVRQLPTTMCALLWEPLPGQVDRFRLCVLWAGDSRAYALLPMQMVLLTKDDVRQDHDDLLEQLINDAPLNNCIHAGGDFVINQAVYNIEAPLCLLVATDGCFAYLPSPPHFEYLLRHTLELSRGGGMSLWAELLQQELHRMAADDVSMALVALGEAATDTALLQWVFTRDNPQFYRRFIAPLNELVVQIEKLREHKQQIEEALDALEQEKQRLRKQLWHDYVTSGRIRQP